MVGTFVPLTERGVEFQAALVEHDRRRRCLLVGVMAKPRPEQSYVIDSVEQRHNRPERFRLHHHTAQSEIKLRGLHRNPQHVEWRGMRATAVEDSQLIRQTPQSLHNLKYSVRRFVRGYS